MDTASIPKTVAAARISFAALTFGTPKLATVFLGAKPSQMTPAAMGWAGLFATREAALGALTLATEDCANEGRRQVLLLNAAVDAMDAFTALRIARRQRSLWPVLLLVPAAVMSVLAHIQEAQKLADEVVDVSDTDSPTGAPATI